MIELTVNGAKRQVDVVAEMPLLWVLRNKLAITSSTYGCGIPQCGACTVQIDGAAVRSCQARIGDLAGKSVLPIAPSARCIAKRLCSAGLGTGRRTHHAPGHVRGPVKDMAMWRAAGRPCPN
jgi:hypothetical protein